MVSIFAWFSHGKFDHVRGLFSIELRTIDLPGADFAKFDRSVLRVLSTSDIHDRICRVGNLVIG